MHHQSPYLPKLAKKEVFPKCKRYQCPILTHNFYVEANITNISKTISINISVNHGTMENINIGRNYSSKEIMLYSYLFKEFLNVFALLNIEELFDKIR